MADRQAQYKKLRDKLEEVIDIPMEDIDFYELSEKINHTDKPYTKTHTIKVTERVIESVGHIYD